MEIIFVRRETSDGLQRKLEWNVGKNQRRVVYWLSACYYLRKNCPITLFDLLVSSVRISQKTKRDECHLLWKPYGTHKYIMLAECKVCSFKVVGMYNYHCHIGGTYSYHCDTENYYWESLFYAHLCVPWTLQKQDPLFQVVRLSPLVCKQNFRHCVERCPPLASHFQEDERNL